MEFENISSSPATPRNSAQHSVDEPIVTITEEECKWNKNVKEKETKDDTSVHVDGNYHLLCEEAIHFYTKASLKKHAKVPPPTPDYDIDYQRPIVHKPLEISKLDSSELPQVSDNGIKFTIESLGQKLGYDQYEYDLVQFWLLDILTDCLWKAQDVFMFEDVQQKVILEWVAGLFKLIADPYLNVSRKSFLLLFKNILFKLYEHISKTCDTFPSTEIIDSCVAELIREGEIKQYENTSESNDDDDEESDDDNDDESSSEQERKRAASASTFSINSFDVRKLKINPEFNIQEHIKHLKTNNPVGNLFHSHSESCSAILSQQSMVSGEGEYAEYGREDLQAYHSSYSNAIPFWSNYAPFKRINHVCGCQLSPSQIYCTCVNRYLLEGEDRDLDYKNLFDDVDQLQDTTAENVNPTSESSSDYKEITTSQSLNLHSTSVQVLEYLTAEKTKEFVVQSAIGVQTETANTDEKTQIELELERQKEVDVMKEWAYFKLMQQRNWDMDDAKVGWTPWLNWLEKSAAGDDIQDFDEVAANFVISVNKPSEDTIDENVEREECEPIRKLNFNILKAIVDFVFEYYYENFHFTLIKLAFRCPPNLITQTINQEWNIPKVIKQQISRPKIKKPKREKRSKSKSSKKSKKSSKSSKSKRSKSSKKSKQRKDKKKKEKGKKGKVKLTPEQKAELEKKRLEDERLEEERLKRDENRVYMFPLADAASETLFMSIFENWVKAKDGAGSKKGKKKGKKGKKGKKKK